MSETLSSPYKGLRPFDDSELDALLFFGRERDREVIAANLLASRLTVLYGPSGVGKSSVLRAGVARQLRGLPEDPVVVVFSAWSSDPIAGLVAAVGAAAGVEGGSLAETLAAATKARGEVYLILDQAEELFLYGEDGFVEQLPTVVNDPGLAVNVLVSVRDDALARLDVFKARMPQVLSNTLRLDRLDRSAGRAAIVRPVERWLELARDGPVEVDPALVEAVLDEVGAGRIDAGLGGRGAAEDVAGEGIETPYLQLVMQRVWDVERAQGSSRLRPETLQELGGAQRIVAEHLESAVAELGRHERDVAALLFNHLVTPSGTKVAHDAADLAEYAGVPPEQVRPVLAQLAEGRIVRPVAREGGGEARYEIFHDVLAGAVLSWRSSHDADRRLERERVEARRRHRFVLAVAGSALLALAVVAAVAVFALVQRASARDQARSAEAGELAALALTELENDPELALLFARDATRLEPSRRNEGILVRALVSSRVRAVLKLPGPVQDVELAGQALVAAELDDEVVVAHRKLFDPKVVPLAGDVQGTYQGALLVAGAAGLELREVPSGRLVRKLPLRPGTTVPIRDVETGIVTGSVQLPRSFDVSAIGPRGTLVAVSDGTRRLVVVNALTGDARYVLEQPSAVTDLVFGPGARILASGGKDGTARLWRVATGKQFAVLGGHKSWVTAVAFSPRATVVATASRDGAGRIWTIGNAQPVAVLADHTNPLTDIVFSPNGEVVATASSDRTARVWKANTGAVLSALAGHADAVTGVRFLDDTEVVTGSRDGTLRRWNVVNAPLLEPVTEMTRPVARVRFLDERRIESVAADGSRLVTRLDGTVLSRGRASPNVRRVAPDGAEAVIDGNEVVLRRPSRESVRLVGHAAPVMSARFSSDGSRVVTASRDNDARIWDARSGAPVATLRGHFGSVNDAAFSPDGRWVVTAGPQTGALWDAVSGAFLFYLYGHEKPLTAAAFDPSGTRIVTGGMDRQVRTYDCEICVAGAELLDAAERRLRATGRRLTDAERQRYLGG